jgi:hypothetical protein
LPWAARPDRRDARAESHRAFGAQAAAALSLDEQQELGTRLQLLNRLERSLHDTEARWQDALNRYR